MPNPLRRRETCLSAVGLFVLTLLPLSSALAQELPLKRTLPGVDVFQCPELELPPVPGTEEQSQARVLGSNADQALILGDQTRARDLLERATELDPSSADLAYRYARILEDLGEAREAIAGYCTARSLGAEDLGMEDVASRLEALVEATQPRLPDRARASYTRGLVDADQGRLEASIAAFTEASIAAPSWPDPVYNRAVILDRLGQTEAAVADFQAYLSMAPEGEDAIAVSQRIGQLQSGTALPSPGSTLALGIAIPGMGQFYSGRAKGGFAVLGLAGSALAAGFLIEKVETRCVGSVSGGGECPPDRVISEETTKPYLTGSLIAAGVIGLVGAVEAFLHVRGSDGTSDGAPLAVDVGPAWILGPTVSAEGPRLTVRLVQVKF
jgi:tetratricopeptide (TPR) repeat protein